MKTNSMKKFMSGSILLSALFGILAGILLIALSADLLLKIVFVIMGIITVFYSLPGITVGLMSFKTTAGKVTLLFSIISAVFGCLMIFWHESFLMFFLGGYLLILPLIQILLAKEKLDQLKSELPKLILGVVMLLIGPAGAIELLFDVAGWIIIILTLIYTVGSLLSLRKMQEKTGGRVFVDHTGDGKPDVIYLDTDGDGNADTEIRYSDDK